MENLIISTICKSESDAMNELAKLAAKHECHIFFSHRYSLEHDYTVLLHVGGNWSAIAKLETALPALAKKLNMEILFKRTKQSKAKEKYLPYKVEIFAHEQSGIVYEISDFFTAHKIHIERWETRTYKTSSQTSIFNLEVAIHIPTNYNIADFRDQFLIFCDEFNLDGILEPEK
jgi:glycine cleavage system transcriptional repressor